MTPSETRSLSGGGETGGNGKGEGMDWRKGRRCARETPPSGRGEGETASKPEREAPSEHAAAAVVPPRHPDDLEKTGSSSIIRSDGSLICGSSSGGGGSSDDTRQRCHRTGQGETDGCGGGPGEVGAVYRLPFGL